MVATFEEILMLSETCLTKLNIYNISTTTSPIIMRLEIICFDLIMCTAYCESNQ